MAIQQFQIVGDLIQSGNVATNGRLETEMGDISRFNTVEHIRLIAEETGEIKRLSGFKKGHRIPDSNSNRDAAFLAEISAEQLDTDLVATFAALRDVYGFKRREISVSGPEEGFGAISTPCFNYEIAVSQLQDQPSRYCLRRSITRIQDPIRVLSAEFESVFSNRFRTIEVLAESNFDIEAIIDRIEEADANSVSVDYDKNVSWCKISLGPVQVEVAGNRIRIVDEQNGQQLRELFGTFQSVQKKYIANLEVGKNWCADT